MANKTIHSERRQFFFVTAYKLYYVCILPIKHRFITKIGNYLFSISIFPLLDAVKRPAVENSPSLNITFFKYSHSLNIKLFVFSPFVAMERFCSDCLLHPLARTAAATIWTRLQACLDQKSQIKEKIVCQRRPRTTYTDPWGTAVRLQHEYLIKKIKCQRGEI